MRKRVQGLAAALAVLAFPSVATASEHGASAANPGWTFDTAPVGNDVLVSMVGTGGPLFARDVRSLSEDSAIGLLQQSGETSRVAVDNWWAQTGAALISENLLRTR